MEEELILQQPDDRRLGNTNTLPPGPPGAEFDTVEFDTKNAPKEPVSRTSSKRRSPSSSPKRKSSSRNRRSPSPVRRRRSPSPRRNRFRDYSPVRRRYDGGRSRRSPDRRRSPPPRDRRMGGRDRYRGRGRSSSRSRSLSPRRSGGSDRWSPKKKIPPSPPPPPSVTGGVQSGMGPSMSQPPPPPQVQTQPPYGVMPPQMYGGDGYATSAYGQYGVPPQAGFPPQPDAYGMQPPPAPTFNTAYPPPSWGMSDVYGQQSWMPANVPDPNQMQQMQQGPMVSAPLQQPPPNAGPGPNLNALPDAAPGTVDASAIHDAAVALEVKNQREELKKQRSGYLKKVSILKTELKMLKEQRKEFNAGDEPPSPTTKRFIDENERLQSQIMKKIGIIENGVDMLTELIGDQNVLKDGGGESSDMGSGGGETMEMTDQKGSSSRSVRSKNKRSSSSESSSESSRSSSTSSSTSSSGGDSSSERLKNKVIESMKQKQKEMIRKETIASATAAAVSMTAVEEAVAAVAAISTPPGGREGRDGRDARDGGNSKYKDDNESNDTKQQQLRCNYVFFDPETYWCQTCEVFPKTAKDFLSHLHSREHMDRESIETPWHTELVTDQYPTFDDAPTKRTPIRGLNFFVPAIAWYCKLCDIWMGDLHCASTHLKSQTHCKKYITYTEKNPHFEENWLADREQALSESKNLPLPAQIKSVSTSGEQKSSRKSKKKDDEKKRKKKSSDKKKRKKKRSKKHRKSGAASSSSSSSSSSSDDSAPSDNERHSQASVNKKKAFIPIKDLDNPNPAASIRVAMRRQASTSKVDDDEVAPPPPPIFGISAKDTTTTMESHDREGKWTMSPGGHKPPSAPAADSLSTKVASTGTDNSKHDDAIMQQWNTVQPVISDSEKKLLEKLKGKLKNKAHDEPPPPPPTTSSATFSTTRNVFDAADKENREKQRAASRSGVDSTSTSDRRRRVSRSRSRGSRVRSATRSRSRGRDYRLAMARRRSRSRSRGGRGGSRYSPAARSGGRRRRRSRSRSPRRRSRSRDRRRRSRSRTRSRSRSKSANRTRVEKPVVKHSTEFRPRVPEKDKEREIKKSTDAKDRRDAQRKASKQSSSSSSTNTNGTGSGAGKKLPFIGKMPVFKKQNAGQNEAGNEKSGGGDNVGAAGLYGSQDTAAVSAAAAAVAAVIPASSAAYPVHLPRPPAPTAAQIQMAMMEDAYGNAPPFHPDAGGMMMDYDDLMPDPVQFVNLMGQVPPPPPPDGVSAVTGEGMKPDDDADILPPGIDQEDSEEFVPKPINDGPMPRKGPLPKDLEEALNIIFPGEKKSDDDDDDDDKKAKPTGETQIITDEPVMQMSDLVKEGIHMVSLEETSLAGMDEASQISMNEPLVFNKPLGSGIASAVDQEISNNPAPPQMEEALSQNAADIDFAAIRPPSRAEQKGDNSDAVINAGTTIVPPHNGSVEEAILEMEDSVEMTPVDMPAFNNAELSQIVPKDASDVGSAAAVHIDLDDIPQPPPSPTESEKIRRQEELNDLAMLGIDADDMAAQCI